MKVGPQTKWSITPRGVVALEMEADPEIFRKFPRLEIILEELSRMDRSARELEILIGLDIYSVMTALGMLHNKDWAEPSSYRTIAPETIGAVAPPMDKMQRRLEAISDRTSSSLEAPLPEFPRGVPTSEEDFKRRLN